MPGRARAEGEGARLRVRTRADMVSGFSAVMEGWAPRRRRTGELLSGQVRDMGGVPLDMGFARTDQDTPAYALRSPGSREVILVAFGEGTYQIGRMVGFMKELEDRDASEIRAVLAQGVRATREMDA